MRTSRRPMIHPIEETFYITKILLPLACVCTVLHRAIPSSSAFFSGRSGRNFLQVLPDNPEETWQLWVLTTWFCSLEDHLSSHHLSRGLCFRFERPPFSKDSGIPLPLPSVLLLPWWKLITWKCSHFVFYSQGESQREHSDRTPVSWGIHSCTSTYMEERVHFQNIITSGT